MELIELKKHNETLKAELEQRKKSEKEAKLEAKRANIKYFNCRCNFCNISRCNYCNCKIGV